MGASGYVHIEVELIKHETDAAFLIVVDGDLEWIPKGQIADAEDYKVGMTNLTMSITEWIAQKKGLEGE